jgi:hypothetical protein
MFKVASYPAAGLPVTLAISFCVPSENTLSDAFLVEL